ncbi:hypothetical protein K439DRAFT_1619190 [Ramaria rubella]|nr:hypothetical protein K439DRAFT_1619190 [Ramaria rubella]
MVAHGFAWDWVEHACVIEIKAIMTDPSNSCTLWIASLIRKVQSFIETCSTGQLELQRKDQPLFCEMEPIIAMVMGPRTAGGHAPFLLDTDLKDYVPKEMISVITQWLQYPEEKTISAVQGKFVNLLLTITNSYDIFLLNAIWKAYCVPKSELFNDRKLKWITDNRIADTCDKFKESPIAQSGSREIHNKRHHQNVPALWCHKQELKSYYSSNNGGRICSVPKGSHANNPLSDLTILRQ